MESQKKIKIQPLDYSISQYPWETPEGRLVWKNQSQYLNWVRGQLRSLWSAYPVRTNWKNDQCRPVTAEDKKRLGLHPSVKFIGHCTYCKAELPKSKLIVDHIVPSLGSNSLEKVATFALYCIAGSPEDWQLVCKPCHDIKTYSERENLSFEEAKLYKRIIIPAKKSTAAMKAAIIEYGEVPESNQTKRLEQLIRLVKERHLA